MVKPYIPDRNHMVWLDFEPTKEREIGKYRPALVLSSRTYNQLTGLLIYCPISTSIRGAATEVPVNNLELPSVVAASLIQTLSWKDRKVKFIVKADDSVYEEVILRIIPLLGTDRVIEKYFS